MEGQTLSNYAVRERLGSGGMGVVYKALDTRLDRHVALKFLPPELTRSADAQRRFVQEAKAASALDHPNICTIHEINETADGQLYLVMAYYAGETLKERIDRGPLDVADAVRIATDVGRGLARAHAAGIVHRDIKPANVMLTSEGQVKIVDFGIAKLTNADTMTATGATLGTVAYMAPEQLRGGVADERTDVWALGVLLYEMLAGQRPFGGESREGTAMAILTSDPPPLRDRCPEAPAALVTVVASCLQKSPDARCATATEAVERLSRMESGEGTPTAATAPIAPAAVEERPSIAVLPFANMSPDKDQDYFCEGLAEELIDAVARLEGLRVVARTSAFQFRGKSHDLAEVGRKLKVKTVLEGSVRKAGNRLRINAQLINAEDGYHLWTQRYDRELDDIFAVQEDIARAVVQQLEVTLLDTPDRTLVARPTASLEAYTCYMRGRYYRLSRFDLEKASQCFEEAARHDPTYAAAWTGVADAAVMAGYLGLQAPGTSGKKARTAIERALALDESLSETYTTLGRIRFWLDWEWDEAERAYLRALELNPSNADALESYAASVLGFLGRTDEALVQVARAREIDPLSVHASTSAATALLQGRRFQEATAAAHQALELQPGNTLALVCLSGACLGRSQHQEAVTHLRHLPNPDHLPGLMGHALAVAGQESEARQMLAELPRKSEHAYVSPFWQALIHLGLGEIDEAMDQLERAYEERSPLLIYLQWNHWDVIRAQPRFQDLHRRVGLPEPPSTQYPD